MRGRALRGVQTYSEGRLMVSGASTETGTRAAFGHPVARGTTRQALLSTHLRDEETEALMLSELPKVLPQGQRGSQG